MSLGLGIFLSTLVVSLLLLYRWTADRWNWKKIRKIAAWSIGSLIGIVLAIGLGIWGYGLYEQRLVTQTSYYDVRLEMTKDEVRYARGIPDHVYLDTKDGWQMVVDTKKLPEGKRVDDYNSWSFALTPNNVARLDIDFEGTSQRVKKIDCFSGGSICDGILGVYAGSSEEAVLERLGKPDSEELDGVTKSMVYSKLNVVLYLKKKKVYMLGIASRATATQPGSK